MSWVDIRSYFNSRCEEQGLSEWEDAFNLDDIPSTLVGNSYHVRFGEFSGEGQNQQDLETLVAVQVQFFVKGYATPKQAVDSAIQKAEAIIKESLMADNRLGQSFKNVIFRSMTIEPFADSNDNIARAIMQFDVRDIIGPC